MATILNKKGFGVEDTPFMILATVAVMMLIVWIGVSVMESFVKGNERQAAVEASTDIYKRAKLASLGYDGSSERLGVSIPEGYAVRIDGSVVALSDSEELTGEMAIQGVGIVSSGSATLGSGDHDLTLIYSAEDGEVIVSW